MADGGHLKKRQACYGPPCQQGDRRHHVRCHGLTILVDHEDTAYVVRNMLFIVIHPATYELMATRGSIVTITEVMQALLS